MVKIQFNEQKQEWEELPKHSREGLYYDRKLLSKLKIIKKRMERDFDATIMIDGEEGSGKSNLSFAVGWYIGDGKLTIDNIAEGTEDAIKKLDRLPDGSVLIVDEGALSFSNKDVMTKEQKRLIKILQIIRQKRMCLIIVAPEIFELNKYISVHRTKFLLHVYAKGFDRGFFAYFSEKNKRILYQVGKKKFNSYKFPKANFYSRFVKFEPFGDAYKELKRKSLREAFNETPTLHKKDIESQCAMKFHERIKGEVPISLIAKGFGVSERTIYRYIQPLSC